MKKKWSISVLLFACFSLLAHNLLPHTHHIDHIHLLTPFVHDHADQGHNESHADEPGHCPFTDLADCHLEDLAFTGKSKRLVHLPAVTLHYNPDMEVVLPAGHAPPPLPVSCAYQSAYISLLVLNFNPRSVPSRAPPVC
jgi:hypothetical protein